jgi:tetratricopeptide (TPR) repeat protein
VVLASATLLVLPLASASGPATDWGDPDHATRLVRHLGADSIRDAYGDEILPSSAAMWGHNLNAAFEQLAQDLGPPGPAFAGLALITLWLPIRGRRLPTKVAAAITWLVFVEVFYAVGINPMGVADRQTALVLGPVLALAVAELFRRLLEPNPRLAWGLAPLCWTVLVLPAALTSVGDIVTTRSWAASAWTRAALAQLPPGGLLLTQSDDLAAGSLHAQQIEGARPDVITFPAQHLHKPMSEAVARTPRAARVWGAAAAGTTEAGRIEAAIAAHDGAVALEHAAATLFTSVRFWSPLGRLPLRVDGRGVAPEIASPRSVHQEIDDWLPRMPAEDDKRRLAEAIANHARGVVRMSGDVPAAVTALEASLRRVSARHASGYVTLAALHDRLGHPERAIELTRQALEIEPDRPVALGNLALYLGRDPATRKEAIEIAKRAALLRPWRSEGWLRVAQLAESEGDVEGAKRARQRAEAARTRGAE